jgi:hypothetical protein
MTQKRLTSLAAFLFLSACSSDAGSDYKQYATLIRQAVSNTMHPPSVSLKEAAAIPYATLGVRLNGGPENIVVLATETAHQQMWTSAAHIVFVTEDGLLKRTVGLTHDLGALAPGSGDTLTPPSRALQGPYMDRRLVDLPDTDVFGAVLTCRGQSQGHSPITILGKTLDTIRVDETCACKSLNWSFVNSYWLGAQSGYVWRSIQHIHPANIVIESQSLRPTE